MKNRFLIIALCMLIGFTITIVPSSYAAGLQYESITVANTSIGFTSTKIEYPTELAVCTLETAQVRFRVDGTAPTSSEGHLMEVGQSLTINNGVEIVGFRAIRTGAVSGVLKCTYR